jgi:hypothetical protein
VEQAASLSFVKDSRPRGRATQNFNTEDPPLSGIGRDAAERGSTIFL